MKNEKKLHGFSYSKNMANFEIFLWSALKIEHHKPIIISEERSSISTFFLHFILPTYLDFSFLEEKNFLDNVDGEAKQS